MPTLQFFDTPMNSVLRGLVALIVVCCGTVAEADESNLRFSLEATVINDDRGAIHACGYTISRTFQNTDSLVNPTLVFIALDAHAIHEFAVSAAADRPKEKNEAGAFVVEWIRIGKNPMLSTTYGAVSVNRTSGLARFSAPYGEGLAILDSLGSREVPIWAGFKGPGGTIVKFSGVIAASPAARLQTTTCIEAMLHLRK